MHDWQRLWARPAGAPHYRLQISEAGRGVPAITPMVNITRLHNAAAAASYMRRITALAQASCAAGAGAHKGR